MTVLSKGQGGTAEGCRHSKIREQCPSTSQLVWSRRHVGPHHLSAAAPLLLFHCLDRYGRGGENLPGWVQYRGHPLHLQQHVGIVGIQHQHHRRNPGKLGEDPRRYLQSVLDKNKSTPKLILCLFWDQCVCVTHQNAASKRWSDFYGNKSEEAQKFPLGNITDPEIKLQLISLQDKGSTVLSEDKAAKVPLSFGFCCNYALQQAPGNIKKKIFI